MKRLLVMVAFLAAGCGAGSATPQIIYVTAPPSSAVAPDNQGEGSLAPDESAPPLSSGGSAKGAKTFEAGTYIVGTDIKPGTYRTRQPSDGCYWARLKGFSGGDDEIANELTDDVTIVTIARGDKGFKTEDCSTWTSDLSQVTGSKTKFGPGMFIVGTDIAPGRYRNTGGDGCYWARLKSFSGDGEIANDLVDGRTIVTIKPTDKGFKSEDCGTWSKV